MKKLFSLFILTVLTLSAWAQTTVTQTSQANALEDNSEFIFNGNAVVTVQMGDYLFVRDDSGNGLIYGTVDGSFENGQVLSQGWNATKSSVNGWVRYTDAAGISASGETNAELAAPQVATSIDESMLNSYVCYQKVKFYMLQRKIKLENGTYIPFNNMFNLDLPGGSMFPSNDPDYNAYGIIGMDGSTVKFIPVAFEKYVEPTPTVLLGDVNGDGFVNVTDITALINAVLNEDFSGIVFANSDMDSNNIINVTDVTQLINHVLNSN